MSTSTSFRPHIPRRQRIINAFKIIPRQMFMKHPELTVFGSTIGLLGLIFAGYKMYVYGLAQKIRPWHRNYYHVVRPDSQIALEWRVPEEYPARYMTNRETRDGLHADRNYGWTLKDI